MRHFGAHEGDPFLGRDSHQASSILSMEEFPPTETLEEGSVPHFSGFLPLACHPQTSSLPNKSLDFASLQKLPPPHGHLYLHTHTTPVCCCCCWGGMVTSAALYLLQVVSFFMFSLLILCAHHRLMISFAENLTICSLGGWNRHFLWEGPCTCALPLNFGLALPPMSLLPRHPAPKLSQDFTLSTSPLPCLLSQTQGLSVFLCICQNTLMCVQCDSGALPRRRDCSELQKGTYLCLLPVLHL